MSRTRIVKGKITERVKGDISIYSASNIIETSLQSIVETGKEKDWKRVPVCSQDSAQSGTPDCPVVHRTVSGAPDGSKVNK